MALASCQCLATRSLAIKRVLFANWSQFGIPAEASYNRTMIRAYDEFVEFIAAGTTPQRVADFQPSEESKSRVADLIHREKKGGLSPEERSELDHYLQLE